jgi:hypothetical protein
MRRTAVILSILLLAAACGTANSQRPATIAAPQIDINPVGSVFFGSGASAPITLEVTIGNPSTTAIIVREIEISSPGMSQYAIRPVRRTVRETIPAGNSTKVNVFTMAYTSVRDPTEPLTLRGIVTFEAGSSRWREIVMIQ